MPTLVSSTISFLFTVIPLTVWIRSLNRIVPDPYLDEFFHIPQAQVYWRGDFWHWDDKITTPPGLYLFSYVWHSILARVHGAKAGASLSTQDLRSDGLVIWLALQAVVWLYQKLERRGNKSSGKSGYDVRRSDGEGESDAGKTWAIMSFPLIFFFSGLYYTDVWSAFTVLATMCAWRASSQSSGAVRSMLQVLQVMLGLVSLGSRQTNVFWVVVFTGGLQAIETVSVRARIHDPSIDEASVEGESKSSFSFCSQNYSHSDSWSDFLHLVLSLLYNLFPSIPHLLLVLWPQLVLLVSFTAFVVYNNGVVLGDKSNHVASLHLAQLLYLWPFIIFFSWPVLLPHLARPRNLLRKRPRWITIFTAGLLATCIVHFNTVIHKFLLADNRHYTFYVFKAIRTRPWTFYAAVPVYLLCAWLAMIALGGTDITLQEETKQQDQQGTAATNFVPLNSHASADFPSRSIRGPELNTDPQTRRPQVNHISLLLVWFLTTSLSLITAPLVEPRYFLMPWLIWRLHVPSHTSSPRPPSQSETETETETERDHPATSPRQTPNKNTRTETDRPILPSQSKMTLNRPFLATILLALADYSSAVELGWSGILNLATCYVFLYRGFRDSREKSVSRFMW